MTNTDTRPNKKLRKVFRNVSGNTCPCGSAFPCISDTFPSLTLVCFFLSWVTAFPSLFLTYVLHYCFVFAPLWHGSLGNDWWSALLVLSSTRRSAVALLLPSSHAPSTLMQGPFHMWLLDFKTLAHIWREDELSHLQTRTSRFKYKLHEKNSSADICCAVVLCNVWQQRVGRDVFERLCWSVWSESRGGAPFCWLSVPLCSPTAVKLLTGTFQERWRKCTIYSFVHTHTHTHTHTRTYCIHTHLEGLHGFTWSAGPQPAAAANNPSSHFSPGSVSTVHPFTALLFKTCQHVCVCMCVSVCLSCMHGGTEQQWKLFMCRGPHSSHITSCNRLHL